MELPCRERLEMPLREGSVEELSALVRLREASTVTTTNTSRERLLSRLHHCLLDLLSTLEPQYATLRIHLGVESHEGRALQERQ